MQTSAVSSRRGFESMQRQQKSEPGRARSSIRTGGELGIRRAAVRPPSLRFGPRAALASSAGKRSRVCSAPRPERGSNLCGGNKKSEPGRARFSIRTGGELGIRTPDSLLGNTRLAGEHLRPLGQLSVTASR